MQKSLSYSKGITTSPSGMLADDTELVESVGMVYKAGEMHPIQKAKKIAELTDERVSFVHKTQGSVNIITDDNAGAITIYNYKDGKLKHISDIHITNTLLSVGAVGSTLVLSTADGMQYARYENGEYIDLGREIPKPSVTFWLGSAKSYEKESYTPPTLTDYIKSETCSAYYSTDRKLCSIDEFSLTLSGGTAISNYRVSDSTPDTSKTLTYRGYDVINAKQTEFNDAVQGIVAHNMAVVKKNRSFAFPFFVRFALRLYDGTYTRISNPVLCLPSIHNNGTLISRALNFGTRYDSDSDIEFIVRSEKVGYFDPILRNAALYFKCTIPNIDKWNDIIKDFVVFASDEVLPFAIDGGWQFCNPSSLISSVIALDYVKLDKYFNSKKAWTYEAYEGPMWGSGGSGETDTYTKGPLTSLIIAKQRKTDDEIKKELLRNSVYYKLFEVKATSPLLDGTTKNNSQDFIEAGVVENLSEQQQLGVDDYYGWTTMSAEQVYTYNSRLNLIGVMRKPFSGFSQFVAVMPDSASTKTYDFYTHIKAVTMDVWVKTTVQTIPEVLSAWFSYPDPNAKELRIVDSSSKVLSLLLQQHPRLNAVYAMDTLPSGTLPTFETDEIPTVSNKSEKLSSQIFTSVVNNPFVFEASGDNTVGTGSIQGIAANTEPISQGQFGQYPLIVFTTEGIYGMSVNAEGLYASSYPISREVCNNAASITPTGKLVFFTSAKGLMAVSGGTVACMSEQLRGRNPARFVTLGDGNFLGFLGNALLAYDYRDSLLHILNTKESYEYVYSIADRTFAKNKLGGSVIAVANAYPDNLVQLADGSVFSLASKPDMNADEERYAGTFTTRPLKLGSSLQLKTIHRILHLFDSEEGTIALRLYGSNDCRNWCELKSLHGKPWKYYTLSYELGNMLATDAFAGTVVDFQTLFPDKIR